MYYFSSFLKFIFCVIKFQQLKPARIPYRQSGRKEMFYLTTHSTHMYLRIYSVGHMVKDHSDSERGNRQPPLHGRLFLTSSKGTLYIPSHKRIPYTSAFVTPVVEYWLEREIAQLVHHEGSIRRPIAPCANALTTVQTIRNEWQRKWNRAKTPPTYYG